MNADPGTVGFAWSETKGVLVSVTGFGIPAEQVRQAAESLERVSANEWAELLKSKDIAIQDDGAPGSETSVSPATTAAGNSSGRAIDPWNVPLLVPRDLTGIDKLQQANDTTLASTWVSPGTPRSVVYAETDTTPGSRAVQLEWSHLAFAAKTESIAVQALAPFYDVVPEGMKPSSDFNFDPNGLHIRVTGRDFTQPELEAIARSVKAPWIADRIIVGALPKGSLSLKATRQMSRYIDRQRSTMDRSAWR